MRSSTPSIKYTAVLPVECVEALKTLASEKKIPSVNFGIRQAVEQYIEQRKKEHYAQEMKKAGQDEAFLKRTLETQEAFSYSDSEVGGDW